MGVHACICNTKMGHVSSLWKYNSMWEEKRQQKTFTWCVTSVGEELSVNVFESLLVDHTTRAFLSRQRHTMKKSSASIHNRNVLLSMSIKKVLINKVFLTILFHGQKWDCEVFLFFFIFFNYCSLLQIYYFYYHCYCGKHCSLRKH